MIRTMARLKAGRTALIAPALALLASAASDMEPVRSDGMPLPQSKPDLALFYPAEPVEISLRPTTTLSLRVSRQSHFFADAPSHFRTRAMIATKTTLVTTMIQTSTRKSQFRSRICTTTSCPRLEWTRSVTRRHSSTLTPQTL